MAKGRKIDTEINASSMADIAFLLLVFFLVTTTMDTDYGLARLLPPPPEENVTPPKFKERNVFVVLVNANDQLLVEGELIDISQLREKAKEFIENPMNKEDLPEKVEITKALCQQKIAQLKSSDDPAAKEELKKWEKKLQTVELIGPYWESKQVISLQNDRGTSYDMYIQVQNELAAAYNELRDELSMKKFGKKFSELTQSEKDKINAIKTVYPQRISEAEPKNTQINQ
ncbi:MAG: biopolymer transporter ExbD [Bacteroidetes bacterium]|nr:MAG: biopolymer transporter ExbD [Bacteroidota bacterium]